MPERLFSYFIIGIFYWYRYTRWYVCYYYIWDINVWVISYRDYFVFQLFSWNTLCWIVFWSWCLLFQDVIGIRVRVRVWLSPLGGMLRYEYSVIVFLFTMSKWTNEWANEWVHEWVNERVCIVAWMCEWFVWSVNVLDVLHIHHIHMDFIKLQLIRFSFVTLNRFSDLYGACLT